MSTVLQILIFLPLTLATLSRQAFLLLSLFLCIHSLIHGTLLMIWGSNVLAVLQVPMHPFLLLLCFNIFSSSLNPWIVTATEWWGTILTMLGPLFIAMEGLSSLLVAQKLGQEGKKLEETGEVTQFGLLIAASATYVASAWWIVDVSAYLLSSFQSLSHAPQVLSFGSLISLVIHPFGCSNNYLSIPYMHRILVASHQNHRVFQPGLIHCLQRLVVWF